MKRSGVFQKLLCVLVSIAVFLCVLTASIGLPIYIRPFYYAHIEAMNLSGVSGYEEQQIRDAYDAVLDYLTLPGREFSTGEIAHSGEGKAHFEDCKVLFDLNLWVFLYAGTFLAAAFLLRRKFGPYRLGKHSACYYGALTALILPVVLGGLAALDFDRAFEIFHTLFFPGKTNWLFNPHTDPIILVMPQEFFMHCAMLIGFGVLTFSIGILLWERKRLKKG